MGSEPAIRSGFTSVKTGRAGAASCCPAPCRIEFAAPPFVDGVGAADAVAGGVIFAGADASPAAIFGALAGLVVAFAVVLGTALSAAVEDLEAEAEAVVFVVDVVVVFVVDFAADLAADFVAVFVAALEVAALEVAVFLTGFGSAFKAAFATFFTAAFRSPTAAGDLTPAFFAGVVEVFFEVFFDGVFVVSFSDRSFAAIG